MTKIKVDLDPAFEHGTLNTAFFKDFKYLKFYGGDEGDGNRFWDVD